MNIECSVENCNKQKRRNGEKSVYCDMHYARFLRTGNAGKAENIKIYSYKNLKCKVTQCDKKAQKKEYCTEHYDSQRSTELDAQTIFDMKKNGCQVCGSYSRLTLDHDHSCCPEGKSCDKCVRGILCHKCNTAAGLLDDDFERMVSLASYILSRKEVIDYEFNK